MARGEVLVWEIVWSLERRSGETQWVYGTRCEDVGMLIQGAVNPSVEEMCQYLDVSIRDQERAAHWHPAVWRAAVLTRTPLQSRALQWVMALQGELPTLIHAQSPSNHLLERNKLLKITPLFENFGAILKLHKVGYGRTLLKLNLLIPIVHQINPTHSISIKAPQITD